MGKNYFEHMYGKMYEANISTPSWDKNSECNTYLPSILEDMLDDEDSNRGSKKMKKCEVCLPDGNGKVQIGVGCIFISPSTTGFMLFSNPEGTVEIHAFGSFKEVLGFMADNNLLDLTQNAIANNI